jgi:hypothetical protein
MPLTTKGVKKLTRNGTRGKYPDGHGLYLQVQHQDNSSWYFRYSVMARSISRGSGPSTPSA